MTDFCKPILLKINGRNIRGRSLIKTAKVKKREERIILSFSSEYINNIMNIMPAASICALTKYSNTGSGSQA
jgi:hypothetical protein